MKNITLYIIFIGFTFLFSCKKADSIKPDLAPEKIRVYNEKNVAAVLSVVPADGVALIVYKSYSDSSYFKLIKNNGDEIWTKNASYLINDYSRIEEVLYNNDNTFSVFIGNRLAIINLDGEVTFNDPIFLKSINLPDLNHRKVNIKITPQGNYLVVGTVLVGTAYRSFYAEVSKAGSLLYKKFFLISARGVNTITDAVFLPNGGCMLGGCFAPDINGLAHQVFLLKIKENGDTLWTSRYKAYPYFETDIAVFLGTIFDVITGRELVMNENNTLSYLFSFADQEAPDQRSKIFNFSSEGILLDTNFLDLSTTNFIPLKAPYFGKSIVKNKEKGYTGISATAHLSISSLNSLSNYRVPHHTYYYNLSLEGKMKNKEFFDKNYNNYFTAIDQLSDGNTIIAGTIFSFDKEIKLIVILR
jgi:hypothetical protein